MAIGGLTWGTEKRLEFIDLGLFCNGVVNRQEPPDRFGVYPQEGSADIVRDLEVAPRSVACNHAVNEYVCSESFNLLTAPDATATSSHERHIILLIQDDVMDALSSSQQA